MANKAENPYVNQEAEANKAMARERMRVVGPDLMRSADWAARRVPDTPGLGEGDRHAAGGLNKEGDVFNILVVSAQRNQDGKGKSFDVQRDVHLTFDLNTTPGKEIHHYQGWQKPDVHLPIGHLPDFREQMIARIERLGRPEPEKPDERIRARTVKVNPDTAYNMPVDKFREMRHGMLIDDLRRLIQHELKKHSGYEEDMMAVTVDPKSDGSGVFRLDVNEGFEQMGKKKYVLGVEWSFVDSTISVIDPETGSKKKLDFLERIGIGDEIEKILAKLGAAKTEQQAT